MRLWRRKSKFVKQEPEPLTKVESKSAPNLSVLVLENLFKKLDFESLLSARAVCQEWSTYISTYILANRSFLRIAPKERTISKWRNSKSVKKLFPTALSVKWNEIYVEELETTKILWKTGLFDFSTFDTLTIFESDFDLEELVGDVLSKMKSLRHLRIFDPEFNERAAYHLGFDTFAAIYYVNVNRKSWKQGVNNIHLLESFAIKIYCWYTSVIYMKLICYSKPIHIREVSLDFSRVLGSICRSKLKETFLCIGKLVNMAVDCLEVFKLKFTRRVETTADMIMYSMRVEVLHEFLEGLRHWPSPEKMRLKCLELLFPIAQMENSYVENILVPFLKCLPNLDTLSLGRCQLDLAFYRFHLEFQETPGLKLSYSMFHNDFEPSLGLLTSYPVMSTVELQTMWSVAFGPSLISNRIYWARNGFQERGCAVKSFRATNSRFNVHFHLFNIPEILSTFPNLEELELLDNSMPQEYCPEIHTNVALIGDLLFNTILETYPRLKSLKLSNLALLTDSGITGVSEPVLQRMEALGSYNLSKRDKPGYSPLTNMKQLQFLELRNLTKKVSDISVYLSIKHIPKLEKVAFHGEHRITKWGTRVLKQQFWRNNLFKVYLKEIVSSQIPTDFP